MERTFVQPQLDDPLTEGFWIAARKRLLVVQQCDDCSHLRFPPQEACPRCASSRKHWQEVAGTGTIWSFVISHPPSLPAFQQYAPFPVALIELDEAPHLRMMGNLVSDESAPINSVPADAIAIGARVQVCFQDQDDKVTLPCWRLEELVQA